MDRFIGIDVHAQTCTLAVMGPSGKHLKETVVETSAKTLRETLRSIAGTRHVCMEEGALSEWLHEELRREAKDLLVVQPEGHAGRKSDSIDAWSLADKIRKGEVQKVVFKPTAVTELRAALRGYVVATNDLVRAKNRLKALFRSRGLYGLGSAVYDPEQQADAVVQLPPALRPLAEQLAVSLKSAIAVQQSAERWLLEQASSHPDVRRLMTLPGVGPVRAATIVAIVVTPHRFRTVRPFWSYCGLGIVSRSSADWVRGKDGRWKRSTVSQTRGLNRDGHPLLKATFKGAAQNIVLRMTTHPLHTDYERLLAAGTKPNLATLTIARRLAAATLAIWKRKEDYDSTKHRSIVQAA